MPLMTGRYHGSQGSRSHLGIDQQDPFSCTGYQVSAVGGDNARAIIGRCRSKTDRSARIGFDMMIDRGLYGAQTLRQSPNWILSGVTVINDDSVKREIS